MIEKYIYLLIENFGIKRILLFYVFLFMIFLTDDWNFIRVMLISMLVVFIVVYICVCSIAKGLAADIKPTPVKLN